jgi:hypothetical protein
MSRLCRTTLLVFLFAGASMALTAPAAIAQVESDTSSSTTRTTLVPGQAAVTQEGSAQNNVGLVVLLVVTAIIVSTGVVLYVRNRGRGNVRLSD